MTPAEQMREDAALAVEAEALAVAAAPGPFDANRASVAVSMAAGRVRALPLPASDPTPRLGSVGVAPEAAGGVYLLPDDVAAVASYLHRVADEAPYEVTLRRIRERLDAATHAPTAETGAPSAEEMAAERFPGPTDHVAAARYAYACGIEDERARVAALAPATPDIEAIRARAEALIDTPLLQYEKALRALVDDVPTLLSALAERDREIADAGTRNCGLLLRVEAAEAERDAASADVAALRREVARHVHGEQVEGDYVCPHEADAERLRGALEAAGGVLVEHTGALGDVAREAVVGINAALATGDHTRHAARLEELAAARAQIAKAREALDPRADELAVSGSVSRIARALAALT